MLSWLDQSLAGMARPLALAVLLTGFLADTFAATSPDLSPPRTPQEELHTFQLPPGLKLELVACEPMVQDPVAMTFDERGRLWVVEMRGFMPDLDRTDELKPTGRISILEDTDGDGRMDRSTVFLDDLVLPRAIALVRDGILVAENKPLWFVPIGRDGKAGRRVLIDPNYGGSGLPEHSGNGLWRGFDNWLYNAKSRARYQYRAGRWVREETEFRGQWGLCHDDWGRLFYNFNWSQLHADFAPPNYLSRNPHHLPSSGIGVAVATNQTVFPIRATPAVNRGYLPDTLDAQGRIREFTSACAPLIYRGDALPAEFHGNAFVCEPAANLIKRDVLGDDGWNLSARPAEPNREFLASTDERFRPVFLADGPDGTLYLADMYRGVIQHGAYMTPYLRAQSEQRGLVQPIHQGRIWRVTPVNWQRPPARPLEAGNTTALLHELASSNGWRRDTAQRLLVQSGDRKALPALRELALHGEPAVARVHALWTLAGLGEHQPLALLPALRDARPEVVAHAIRVLESLTVANKRERERFLAELEAIAGNASARVRLQILLTAGGVGSPQALDLMERLVANDVSQPLVRDAAMSGLAGKEAAFLERVWRRAGWHTNAPGRAELLEALAAATVRGGNVREVQSLLARLEGPPGQFGWREQAVLSGLALHAGRRECPPIALAREPAVLAHASQFTDRAALGRIERLNALFSWPGHAAQKAGADRATPLTAKEEELFVKGRQQFLAICAGCHGMDGAGIEPQAPPLLDSQWALGDQGRLVRIVLQGVEGPITVNGTRYEAPRVLTEMPSLAVMDNESIAAVLTYIRREWGHTATPVSMTSVSQVRNRTQGRGRPWTEPELLQLEPFKAATEDLP